VGAAGRADWLAGWFVVKEDCDDDENDGAGAVSCACLPARVSLGFQFSNAGLLDCWIAGSVSAPFVSSSYFICQKRARKRENAAKPKRKKYGRGGGQITRHWKDDGEDATGKKRTMDNIRSKPWVRAMAMD